MADEVFTFDADSVERIAEAVRKIEGLPPNRRPPVPKSGRIGAPFPDTQIVRVTSATETAGKGYPAKIQAVDTSTYPPTYSDLDDCYAVAGNAGVLQTDKYGAIRKGNASDGKALFHLLFPVGWTGTFLEVSDVT